MFITELVAWPRTTRVGQKEARKERESDFQGLTGWELADNLQGSEFVMNGRGTLSYVNLQNSFGFLGDTFIQYYFYNM